MPPKNTKKNSAKSAIPKSKTPGPEIQPKEYVSNYFAIHRLLSFELMSEQKKNQFLTLEYNKTVNLFLEKMIISTGYTKASSGSKLF